MEKRGQPSLSSPALPPPLLQGYFQGGPSPIKPQQQLTGGLTGRPAREGGCAPPWQGL